MIKAIQAKPITGMSFSPTSAQESQSESVAAPAEVGQGLGTHHDLCECRTCISKSPTCAACGSTNTEPCCHPAEFCQAICNDCNKPLNADGSVWVEKQEPTLEQFERWLDDRMISLASEAANPCTTKSDAAELQAESDRTLTSLMHVYEFLRSFKLEQGA